jgi:plastocyanin
MEAGPEDAKSADETRKPGSMQTVQVGPGETVTWRLTSAEVPKEVVVDPDVKLLQLGRKLAKRAIP